MGIECMFRDLYGYIMFSLTITDIPLHMPDLSLSVLDMHQISQGQIDQTSDLNAHTLNIQEHTLWFLPDCTTWHEHSHMSHDMSHDK